MSDRRARLEALASKRKHQSDDEETNKPVLTKKNKPTLQKRPVKPNKYVDSESESEEDNKDDDDSEEEEEEEEEDNSSEEEQQVKPKKRSSNPIRKPVKKASKGSDDEHSDDDKSDISDDELEQLDSSLIIKGGRRTRGRTIDYTQFGADPVDEE